MKPAMGGKNLEVNEASKKLDDACEAVVALDNLAVAMTKMGLQQFSTGQHVRSLRESLLKSAGQAAVDVHMGIKGGKSEH